MANSAWLGEERFAAANEMIRWTISSDERPSVSEGRANTPPDKVGNEPADKTGLKEAKSLTA